MYFGSLEAFGYGSLIHKLRRGGGAEWSHSEDVVTRGSTPAVPGLE